MDVVKDIVEAIQLPQMTPVRQIFDDTHIVDLEAHLDRVLSAADLKSRIKPGASVALGVGSRGLADLPVLVRCTVAALKAAGAEPFVVPAMGSHGGATDEGQANMLKSLGVTEETVGCPVRSSIETVEVGRIDSGLAVLMDKIALSADHIALINRVKPHTSFSGPIESGLTKMIAIGLANQKGADACHAQGFGMMAENIVKMAEVKLAKAPFLFGLATVENAYDRIAIAEVVMAEDILTREPELLKIAKAKMPRILFDPIDVLVVDEMGKEYSGTGMDPNITGRAPTPFIQTRQEVGKLAVLALSKKTRGNCTGLGLADFCTRRLFEAIDYRSFYTNHLTSTTMAGAKIPMIMETARMAVQGALKTSNAPDPARQRVVRLANTLAMEHILISEALLDEARAHPQIEIVGPPQDWAFAEEAETTPEPA